jgi:hypothetical protein
MEIVDLQRPEYLPDYFLDRLDSIKSICRNEEFSETLVKHPDVLDIVIDLNKYCLQRRILGIHYTRAVRADIEQQGLLVRTGNQIREDFIDRFGHEFEDAELIELRRLWSSHQEKQSNIRDAMLWFNFTLDAYGGSGSEYLLGMYGGEQIHMGIDLNSPIGGKLASIGEPLIVMCTLDPSKVETFVEYPWGKILTSSFHLSIEPGAIRIDQDGKMIESVSPENVRVQPASEVAA